MPDIETRSVSRRELLRRNAASPGPAPENPDRRDFMVRSGVALAGLTLLQACSAAQAFPSRPGEKIVAWSDQPPENPVPEVVANQLRWEDFDSWITPNDKFFSVAHYDRPVIDPKNWRLEITGLVKHPMTLTLDDLQNRPRQEVDFTVECSGNHGFPWFQGGIGTAHWAGTPLARILKEAGPQREAIEVAFYGADSGEETVREIKMQQHFARSMTIEDALKPDNLLCYEMNGAPLPAANGAPLRLIAPGWYGIANVKWLTRIELRDRRLMNRFMARDYVTIREEKHDGESVWAETSVGPARIKSAPAKVTVLNGLYRIIGAAWGADIAGIEVRVDDGPWRPATIEKSMDGSANTWKVWSMDWTDATTGDHAITSRAIAKTGEMQPAMDDPMIANKHTYWESNGYVTRHVRVG